MTENPKSPTPGISEVSPKFVDAAQAASTDEALSVLWQEHKRLTTQYSEAIKQADRAMTARQAIADVETSEYRTAATALEAANEHQQEVSDSVVAEENRMARMPARTVAGTLLKLRVVGAEITGEFTGPDGTFDETALGSAERLSLSALADLERLVGEAAEPEDPVLALKREWEARWDRYESETDEPEEVTDQLNDRVNEVAYEIFQTPATTPAGIAFKLILWARQHITRGTQENPDWSRPPVSAYSSYDLDHLPVVSALHDLERMAQGIAPSTIKEPVIDEPLLALERRWRKALKTLDEATPESPPKPSPDDMMAAISDVQEKMAVTPARTLAGVLIKLRLYADLNGRAFSTDRDCGQSIGPVVSIDQLPLDNLELDETAVVGAMRDLEHMAAMAVASTLPTEDAALFDALAEHDRLATISNNLERRKDVFRPGIPEALEANKAYEAAYDETMKAWATARDIPATSQAGLFAKLQEAVRFMADLGEDELYEAEWSAIKADVQRMAG